MPELNAHYGYPICLLVMALIAAVELWFFYTRGWIFEKRDRVHSHGGPAAP